MQPNTEQDLEAGRGRYPMHHDRPCSQRDSCVHNLFGKCGVVDCMHDMKGSSVTDWGFGLAILLAALAMVVVIVRMF